MMTYLALEAGAGVRAAAVIGAPADLEAGLARRPEMDEVYRDAIRDYATQKSARLRERSAIHWAEKLTVPILLMHGSADWRVSPEDSKALARKLTALGRPHELVVYSDDDHPLTKNAADAFQRMLDWFAKYRTRP